MSAILATDVYSNALGEGLDSVRTLAVNVRKTSVTRLRVAPLVLNHDADRIEVAIHREVHVIGHGANGVLDVALLPKALGSNVGGEDVTVLKAGELLRAEFLRYRCHCRLKARPLLCPLRRHTVHVIRGRSVCKWFARWSTLGSRNPTSFRGHAR